MNDQLHKLIRQQQFADHDARRWPTSKEQLRQHVGKLLGTEASQVKLLPTLERFK